MAHKWPVPTSSGLLLPLAGLLLALLVGHGDHNSAAATPRCPSSVKRLLGSRSSYEKLADILFESTFHPQLEKNVQIASVLMREPRYKSSSKEFKSLVWHFAMLNGGGGGGDDDDDGEPHQLCEPENLANVRSVAESMHCEGNLSPKQVTEAVRRLNMIVISLVEKAHTICFKHLESRWPKPKRPREPSSVADMAARLSELSSLPASFIFEGYLGERKPADAEARDLGQRLREIIERAETSAGLERKQTENETAGARLARRLDEFVLGPCAHFVASLAGGRVLEPYANLLIASFIIEPELKPMRKFYEDLKVRPRLQWVKLDRDVFGMAHRFQACRALAGQSREHLVKLVRRAQRGPGPQVGSAAPSVPELDSIL